MKSASAKGPVKGLPDDTKGSLPHPDLKLQSDESDMSCNQNDNEDETGKDDDLEDDDASVANLTLMLQELELEEEALLKKRKLNELKELVAAKRKSVKHLKPATSGCSAPGKKPKCCLFKSKS